MPTTARLPVALLLALATVPPRPARAQEGAPPPPGARVRVWSHLLSSGRAVGLFQSVDSATVSLVADNGSMTRIALGAIDSVQVSRGWEAHTGRGALIGAITGGVVLALLGAANTSEGEVIDPAAVAGLGFIAGAAGGAFVGGVIAHVRGHERWGPVPAWRRVGAGPRRDARIVFAVGRRFR